MKKIFCLGSLILGLALIKPAPVGADVEPMAKRINQDVLLQTAPFNALLGGLYDGSVTFGQLKGHGDFGLGTFDKLDGEMTELDGVFYQTKTDGKTYPVADSMTTPLANITFFDTDRSFVIRNQELTFDKLAEAVTKAFPSKNIPYAIRIDGTFKYVKTRAVPAQVKPYPKLVDVVKKQSVFEFHDVKGTIVAFWLPEFFKDINVPGFHWHFLTEDRTGGGHLLDCQASRVTVRIDYTYEFGLLMPPTQDYYNLDLSGDKHSEIQAVEKDTGHSQ